MSYFGVRSFAVNPDFRQWADACGLRLGPERRVTAAPVATRPLPTAARAGAIALESDSEARFRTERRVQIGSLGSVRNREPDSVSMTEQVFNGKCS
jgi:hypothetical protein